jgi:aspartate aminotransferase
MRNEGHHIYKLGLGQSPFPVPEIVTDELRNNAYQKDYLPVKGLKLLREAIAEYHFRKQDVNYSGEDVLIGPGSKELMFLIQLVYYGDLVIPTPSWVSYAPQANIIGRHVRWLPSTKDHCWRVTAAELENLCKNDPDRPRILILNYPSNPTGCTYKIEGLKELARVARKYKVVLLSDEIYGELHHKGEHISISRFYPEGTIISSGLSKWCGAGGWRLGYFVFPESLRWLQDGMASVASETFTSTSAPIQYAAVRAYRGGIEMEHYLFQSRRILKALSSELVKRLRVVGLGLPEPEGAFYLFPDFEALRARLADKEIFSSQQLVSAILTETGVALLPGSDFGRPENELTLRLAYVDFDGAYAIAEAEQISTELELDLNYLNKACGRMLEAVDRICDWTRSL